MTDTVRGKPGTLRARRAVTLTSVAETRARYRHMRVSRPPAPRYHVLAWATGDVGGTVAPVLALTLGAPASFGAFTPGVGHAYTASTTATVTSTAGDAQLTVSDPTGTGRLVNGAHSLAQPVEARAGGAFAAVGAATPLRAYGGPVANDVTPVEFRQSIGANEGLRTGTYAKTLTFTLSTTSP